MARFFWRAATAYRYLLVLTLIGVSDFSAPQPARAGDPLPALQSQIAAGEFAPALVAVRQLPTDQRDTLLGQIAGAQLQAGDRRAALSTASELSSDVARSRLLVGIANKPMQPAGAMGGNQVDFDTTMNLIKSTIAPTSWDDVGGTGSIQGFPGGVYVDAHGTLAPLIKTDHSQTLDGLRMQALHGLRNETSASARTTSTLRKVSLTRLEKQVQLRLAAGQQPSEEMAALAGLQRIQYVLVYPEQGDIVLAGPAGDWQKNAEGRLVNRETGHPVLQLDDLVVILRHMLNDREGRFGCSIDPTETGLAATRAFVEESNKTPLKPGQRDAWLKKLRDQMGQQDIVVYGVDPRTRVGRVMVEADYRMKRVGLGLEDSVLGVPSYLSSLTKEAASQPLDVLRWWFTLNYDAVSTTANRDAFQFRGQGVKVLSENELLTALGKRVHTGASNEQNAEFAHNFTEHFPALAKKYPIYAELQNVFDLALVGALLKSENLPERLNWHLTCFGDAKQYRVSQAEAPSKVETIINHRVIEKVNIIAAVSGGVTVEPTALVKREAMKVDTYGTLQAERGNAKPKELPRTAWWWD